MGGGKRNGRIAAHMSRSALCQSRLLDVTVNLPLQQREDVFCSPANYADRRDHTGGGRSMGDAARGPCIYCRALAQPGAMKPPREHVIPASLSAGFAGNLTIPCVCLRCNRRLGKELDQILVEGTLLGPLRYRSGLKQDVHRAPVPRAPRFTVLWRGMNLQLRPRADGLDYELHLPTQVGFRCRETGEFRYWLLSELCTVRTDAAVDTDGEHHIVGEDPSYLEDAVRSLAEVGIESVGHTREQVPLSGSSPGGEPCQLDVETCTLVDTTIKRSMAKIAFNYLAWIVMARTGRSDWLMRDEFDTVRSYVVDPASTSGPRLATGARPQWRGSPGAGALTGHVVTLSWERGRTDIVARVSLFSELSWDVELARSFRGVWWELSSGHLWDLDTRTVSMMRKASI